ncbi:MAG TPA: hypothetical protein VNW73_18970 [Ktedonobacteraceae bacterium]|jgi:hypothetical protein|nr:hypothetical protein [Ktedonobacteraceae bacterium]
MSDFGISNVSDEDQVEITDLDPQDGSSSASLSLVLLKLARRVPLFANPRVRFTMLVWLVCLLMLLFLVQPGLPNVSRQTPVISARDLQYPLAIISTTSSHNVTWVRISNGKVIVIQAGPGRIVWHHCKVQRWFAPPKYAHPTVVICT